MKFFEYKEIKMILPMIRFKDTDCCTIDLEELNKEGSEGWELTAADFKSGKAYLKRQKPHKKSNKWEEK